MSRDEIFVLAVDRHLTLHKQEFDKEHRVLLMLACERVLAYNTLEETPDSIGDIALRMYRDYYVFLSYQARDLFFKNTAVSEVTFNLGRSSYVFHRSTMQGIDTIWNQPPVTGS